MFRLIPVSCMITRAVRIDSGMEIAATSVERTLNRNRKIVRTANSAPRPPSRTSPSVDSLMKSDRSDTVVTTMTPGCRAAISSSLAWTSSATRTVFASDVLVTDSDSDGLPLVRANPVVATSSSSTVPRSPMVIGVGAARRRRRARTAQWPGWRSDRPGPAADGGRRREADDEVLDVLLRGQSTDRRDRDLGAAIRQLAGRECQVVGRQHAGDLGHRHPGRCQLVGVQRDGQAGLEATGHVRTRDAVDGGDLRHDLGSGDLRGGLQAVLRGRADGRDDDRRGIDVEGRCGRLHALRQAGVGDALFDRGESLLDVRAVLELGDDQGDGVGRGRLHGVEPGDAGDGAFDRLGHLVGDVLRAGTRVRGDHGDDRELDVGQEFLLEAAPRRDAGDEERAGQKERDAPLADGQRGETVHERSPFGSVAA